MNIYMQKQKTNLMYRVLCGFVAFTFTFSMIIPPQASAQGMINLPLPGVMLPVSPGFTPAIVHGITIHPDNPLMFDFLVGRGDDDLEGEDLKVEADKLIKYFLATLTTPEDQLWVNLSPYEKDRMIPQSFGETEMGRDLLAQDYLLKQLTASMMYPEDDLGQKFWTRVYKRAQEEFGTTEIPMNTFNKIWIVPQKAVVYQKNGSAYVLESHLKVMLEEDYLALNEAMKSDSWTNVSSYQTSEEVISGVQSEIIREILIPEIEKEVNEGETFANLRQIYNSMILATWYKMNLKESLLGQVYVDQNKNKGIESEDKKIKEKIYQQYLEAFKTGVYNYIREDIDAQSGEMIPRKYFSGGVIGDVKDVMFTINGDNFLSDLEKATLKKGFKQNEVAKAVRVAISLVETKNNKDGKSLIESGAITVREGTLDSQDQGGEMQVAVSPVAVEEILKDEVGLKEKEGITQGNDYGVIISNIDFQEIETDSSALLRRIMRRIEQSLSPEHRITYKVKAENVLFREDILDGYSLLVGLYKNTERRAGTYGRSNSKMIYVFSHKEKGSIGGFVRREKDVRGKSEGDILNDFITSIQTVSSPLSFGLKRKIVGALRLLDKPIDIQALGKLLLNASDSAGNDNYITSVEASDEAFVLSEGNSKFSKAVELLVVEQIQNEDDLDADALVQYLESAYARNKENLIILENLNNKAAVLVETADKSLVFNRVKSLLQEVASQKRTPVEASNEVYDPEIENVDFADAFIEYAEALQWVDKKMLDATLNYLTRIDAEKVKDSSNAVAASPVSSSSLKIKVASYQDSDVLKEKTIEILTNLFEQYGVDVFTKEGEINEHELAKGLVPLAGTSGFDQIIRKEANLQDIYEYKNSTKRGEWARLIPSGGDATRLGLSAPKVLADLKEILSDEQEEALDVAIEKALNKTPPEINNEQIQVLRALRGRRDELQNISIIGRVLQSIARELEYDKEVLNRQTFIITPGEGDEYKVVQDLKDNNFYGFSPESFVIQPQVKNPMYKLDGEKIVESSKKKAGGNGVPIIETSLSGKAFYLDEQGSLVKLEGSAVEYIKERGAKYVMQGTIGDLRGWNTDPLNAGFAGVVYKDLVNGKVDVVAEYVKQNPELIQKGGTSLFSKNSGKLVFIEKMAMGEQLLKDLNFATQPLATFNHIFTVNALEKIPSLDLPLYVRADKDDEGEPILFTELVGGDLMTSLEDLGLNVSHVERNIKIKELKGTASLISAITEALVQDAVAVGKAQERVIWILVSQDKKIIYYQRGESVEEGQKKYAFFGTAGNVLDPDVVVKKRLLGIDGNDLRVATVRRGSEQIDVRMVVIPKSAQEIMNEFSRVVDGGIILGIQSKDIEDLIKSSRNNQDDLYGRMKDVLNNLNVQKAIEGEHSSIPLEISEEELAQFENPAVIRELAEKLQKLSLSDDLIIPGTDEVIGKEDENDADGMGVSRFTPLDFLEEYQLANITVYIDSKPLIRSGDYRDNLLEIALVDNETNEIVDKQTVYRMDIGEPLQVQLSLDVDERFKDADEFLEETNGAYPTGRYRLAIVGKNGEPLGKVVSSPVGVVGVDNGALAPENISGSVDRLMNLLENYSSDVREMLLITNQILEDIGFVNISEDEQKKHLRSFLSFLSKNLKGKKADEYQGEIDKQMAIALKKDLNQLKRDMLMGGFRDAREKSAYGVLQGIKELLDEYTLKQFPEAHEELLNEEIDDFVQNQLGWGDVTIRLGSIAQRDNIVLVVNPNTFGTLRFRNSTNGQEIWFKKVKKEEGKVIISIKEGSQDFRIPDEDLGLRAIRQENQKIHYVVSEEEVFDLSVELAKHPEFVSFAEETVSSPLKAEFTFLNIVKNIQKGFVSQRGGDVLTFLKGEISDLDYQKVGDIIEKITDQVAGTTPYEVRRGKFVTMGLMRIAKFTPEGVLEEFIEKEILDSLVIGESIEVQDFIDTIREGGVIEDKALIRINKRNKTSQEGELNLEATRKRLLSNEWDEITMWNMGGVLPRSVDINATNIESITIVTQGTAKAINKQFQQWYWDSLEILNSTKDGIMVNRLIRDIEGIDEATAQQILDLFVTKKRAETKLEGDDIVYVPISSSPVEVVMAASSVISIEEQVDLLKKAIKSNDLDQSNYLSVFDQEATKGSMELSYQIAVDFAESIKKLLKKDGEKLVRNIFTYPGQHKVSIQFYTNDASNKRAVLDFLDGQDFYTAKLETKRKLIIVQISRIIDQVITEGDLETISVVYDSENKNNAKRISLLDRKEPQRGLFIVVNNNGEIVFEEQILDTSNQLRMTISPLFETIVHYQGDASLLNLNQAQRFIEEFRNKMVGSSPIETLDELLTQIGEKLDSFEDQQDFRNAVAKSIKLEDFQRKLERIIDMYGRPEGGRSALNNRVRGYFRSDPIQMAQKFIEDVKAQNIGAVLDAPMNEDESGLIQLSLVHKYLRDSVDVKRVVRLLSDNTKEALLGELRKQDVWPRFTKALEDSSSSVGGIDLNPELLDLQIIRDGNGIPLPVWDQPIETMNIEGFVPVIINVAPVTNLPLLLGLDLDVDTDSQDDEYFSVSSLGPVNRIDKFDLLDAV